MFKYILALFGTIAAAVLIWFGLNYMEDRQINTTPPPIADGVYPLGWQMSRVEDEWTFSHSVIEGEDGWVYNYEIEYNGEGNLLCSIKFWEDQGLHELSKGKKHVVSYTSNSPPHFAQVEIEHFRRLDNTWTPIRPMKMVWLPVPQ